MYKCLSPGTGPVNDTRSILCEKFVDVHKVIVHEKFQSSKPFGFKQRFLSFRGEEF